MNKMTFSLYVLMISFFSVSELVGQHLHIQTLSGDCVDVDNNEPACCCESGYYGYYRYRWYNDQMAEEQFEDTGWPSRRDELSDSLIR